MFLVSITNFYFLAAGFVALGIGFIVSMVSLAFACNGANDKTSSFKDKLPAFIVSLVFCLAGFICFMVGACL